MMGRQLAVRTKEDLLGVIEQPPQYTAGIPIGIIGIDLVYPKLPGNVVNASSFDFPVLYKKVRFEIEALFRGDPQIKEQIVLAARELEEEGVRAIIGACGFFAHFQDDVKKAVDVPVYLSSLCQLPVIRTGLRKEKKIAVIAASGDSVTEELLVHVGGKMEDIEVFDVGGWESFSPIRWGSCSMDNGKLTGDLFRLGRRIRDDHPEIGAILLECSDLPPYAWVVQEASELPVYDFITLIRWVKNTVTQEPYYGII